MNVAARLEGLAERGILVSNTVYEHIRDRLPLAFKDLGEQQVKNIVGRCGFIGSGKGAAPIGERCWSAQALPLPSIAVLPFANMSDDPEQC